MNVFTRFREAWSVFRGRDGPNVDWSSGDAWGSGRHVTQFTPGYLGGGGWNGYGSGPISADRPDRLRLKNANEKTILASVYNRIALDVANVEFHHALIDENDMFKEAIKGSMEDAFTLEANIDQAAQAYMIDLVMSLFDEGVVAEVPIECDRDDSGAITDKLPLQLRTGKVIEWRPQEIKVNVYDELRGDKYNVPVPKRETCIIENPFYTVMNHKNSVASRLSRKMAILDMVDDKLGSDKLNMILQLPYVIRTDAQRTMARNRLKEMQEQLEENKLGITYTDGTEKVIQLNRPIETNLQSQIEWLTKLLLSQLCMTEEILNGTADSKVMANYMQRCVGVVCTAIVQERRRKLLTKEQREKGESIVFVQDPFKLIPVTELAELMDKTNRGGIMSPNEWRSVIGYKPSDDATSDMLVNRNMPMNQTPEGMQAEAGAPDVTPEMAEMPPEMQHSAMPLRFLRKGAKDALQCHRFKYEDAAEEEEKTPAPNRAQRRAQARAKSRSG